MLGGGAPRTKMADISNAGASPPISPFSSNQIEEQFKEMCFYYIVLCSKEFSVNCEAVYLFIEEVYECASYGLTLVSGLLNEEEYTKTVIVSVPFRRPSFLLANVSGERSPTERGPGHWSCQGIIFLAKHGSSIVAGSLLVIFMQYISMFQYSHKLQVLSQVL